MLKHLFFWAKCVVRLPLETLEDVVNHIVEVGLRVRPYKGPPKSLELAKLWETDLE